MMSLNTAEAFSLNHDLGTVASNGVKMSLVWFEGGCRLTSAVYKGVLETKVLPWVKKITKEAITRRNFYMKPNLKLCFISFSHLVLHNLFLVSSLSTVYETQFGRVIGP